MWFSVILPSRLVQAVDTEVCVSSSHCICGSFDTGIDENTKAVKVRSEYLPTLWILKMFAKNIVDNFNTAGIETGLYE